MAYSEKLRKAATWFVRSVAACLAFLVALVLALVAMFTIDDFVVDVWSVHDLRFVSASVVRRGSGYDLDVTFESPSTDFYQAAFQGNYKLEADPVLCSDYDGDRRLSLAADPYLYGPYGRVDYPTPASRSEPGGPATSYHVYLSPAWREDCGFNTCIHAYDLVRTPEDVCFTVYGGRYVGLVFRSNKVVVPKAAIAAAIASAYIDWGRHYDASLQVYR